MASSSESSTPLPACTGQSLTCPRRKAAGVLGACDGHTSGCKTKPVPLTPRRKAAKTKWSTDQSKYIDIHQYTLYVPRNQPLILRLPPKLSCSERFQPSYRRAFVLYKYLLHPRHPLLVWRDSIECKSCTICQICFYLCEEVPYDPISLSENGIGLWEEIKASVCEIRRSEDRSISIDHDHFRMYSTRIEVDGEFGIGFMWM